MGDYFSADTEGIYEMRARKNIDVVFVCMNLPYTMPPDEAAEAVRAFHPRSSIRIITAARILACSRKHWPVPGSKCAFSTGITKADRYFQPIDHSSPPTTARHHHPRGFLVLR